MNNKDEKILSVEQILQQIFDVSQYPKEEQERILSESADLILETALLRALEDAGEEVQEKFSQLMAENPSPETIGDFIQKYIPDFDKYLAEEIQIFVEMNGEDKKEDAEKTEGDSQEK